VLNADTYQPQFGACWADSSTRVKVDMSPMHVKMVETLYQSGEVTGNKIDAATASEILLRDPLMYRNWTGRLSVCEKNVLTVFGKMTKAKHD
jgi:hypothetical protein